MDSIFIGEPTAAREAGSLVANEVGSRTPYDPLPFN